MKSAAIIVEEAVDRAMHPDVSAAARAVLVALEAAGEAGLEHDAVRRIAGPTLLPAVLLFHAGFVSLDDQRRFRLTRETRGRLAACASSTTGAVACPS